MVDDLTKSNKQTNELKLVEETVAELTSQGHPFSKSETLVFPEIQKSSESLFLRKGLGTPRTSICSTTNA